MIRKTVNIYGEQEIIENAIDNLMNDGDIDKIEVFDSPLTAFWQDEAESVIRGFFSCKPDEIDDKLEQHSSDLCNEFISNSDSIIDVQYEHDLLRDLIK